MKDYLWLNIKDLPYFRALLRAVEARFYQDLEMPGPVLDVGCGDGHFASIAFDRPIDIGFDPWWGPLREAGARKSYQMIIQAKGDQIPFGTAHFGSAISNSVLEHIPDLEPVLVETARVLKPGAPFYFCVPSQNFLNGLSIGRSLDTLGFNKAGNAYRTFFNQIARHHHCDSPVVWQERLERCGFEVEQWWHYYSPAAMRVSEWGHYLGLPALICQKLTGHWILAPTRWNLGITYSLIKQHYETDPRCEDGVCTFYIARRKSE